MQLLSINFTLHGATLLVNDPFKHMHVHPVTTDQQGKGRPRKVLHKVQTPFGEDRRTVPNCYLWLCGHANKTVDDCEHVVSDPKQSPKCYWYLYYSQKQDT